jgi:hypothetical protein
MFTDTLTAIDIIVVIALYASLFIHKIKRVQ